MTTKEWESFLKENRGRIEQVDESDGTIYYKFVVRNARDAAELEQLEAAAIYESPEGSVFARVSTHIDRIPGIRGDEVTPEYLFLADCSENAFLRAEEEFAEKWNVFPHYLCPQHERIILMRSELDGFSDNVELFIPISDLTTQGELGRRWREVASMQKAVYGKKKRPNRGTFGTLLKVYDLRQKYTNAQVAKSLVMNPSTVEKGYRRVHIDIHGFPPPKPLKENSRPRNSRKTKPGFSAVAGTHEDTESPSEVLHTVFVDLGLPLDKLDAPHKLNAKQKKLLKDALHLQAQEYHRRHARPKSAKQNPS